MFVQLLRVLVFVAGVGLEALEFLGGFGGFGEQLIVAREEELGDLKELAHVFFLLRDLLHGELDLLAEVEVASVHLESAALAVAGLGALLLHVVEDGAEVGPLIHVAANREHFINHTLIILH